MIGSLAYLTIIVKVLKWRMAEIYETIKPALFSSILTCGLLAFIKVLLKSFYMPDIAILESILLIGIPVYALFIRLLFADTYEFILENAAKFAGSKMFNLFIRDPKEAEDL